jgi:FtsP/CotA-like multicopper oxidase with cupredoxin domain
MRGPALIALLAGACACGETTEGEPAPPAVPSLPQARDLDPAPGVVHVELFATRGAHTYLDGKPAEVWGYSQASGEEPTIPGPTIEANVGHELVIGITNELDVGTTVHWHGLRLPARADGSSATQDPIAPGARYEARFVARDAGTFWYHPHIEADVQIERGLYGALIVHEPAPPSVDADRMFVLDDVKLSGDGRLSEDTDALDLMLGRQGNVVVVNGKPRASLAITPGAVERWRFVNVANGRFFKLRLEGQRFRVVAWDGGALVEPYDAETLLIAPGERYEVLVAPIATAGEALTLTTEHYDRGHDIPDPGSIVLMDLRAEGASLPARALPALDAPPFEGLATTATTTVKTFVLRELEDEAGLRFLINDEVWPFNTHVRVQQGATEIWEIDNRAEMDHPFHVHGMFFDVLSIDGAPPAHRGWKDTVNVPRESKLRFAVRYDPLGTWMFHCHILEHAERGMMGELMVMARP